MKLKTLGLAISTAMLALSANAADIKPIAELTTADLTIPNKVETTIGTMNYFDGAPTKITALKAYDYLDTSRAVDAFIKGVPGASAYAMLEGIEAVAPEPHQVLIFDNMMDSKSLFLTGNSSTVYVIPTLDLKQYGAMVMDVPPGMLGGFNDSWFRYVDDIGAFGQDKMKGGKYLILPPGYDGEVPAGYFIVKSPTYRVLPLMRASITKGVDEAVTRAKTLKVYPLSEKDNQKPMEFVSGSSLEFNTIHSNDVNYYHHLNEVIQYEPLSILDKETRGLFAAIGIEKGKLFNPNARMQNILEDGFNIGTATTRSMMWYPRTEGELALLKETVIYSDADSEWHMAYAGKNTYFDGADHSTMNSDARAFFHYMATFAIPSMAMTIVGAGSDYAITYKDGDKNIFDGGKTYKLTLPKDVPVANFWAVTLYDTQTRSMLQTEQLYPSVDSNTENLKQNSDGSYSIYFSPKPVAGFENNWIQTLPNKSWFTILRMYGPEKAWIEKTWRPSEVEPVVSSYQ